MEVIVNIQDVPVLERQHARVGRLLTQSLLSGSDGDPENFYLQLSSTHADFESPRHRHNFDQVRVQIAGDAHYGRDGTMREGTIGYFPEGVFYGPTTMTGPSTTLLLQFGGVSGSGYISTRRFQAALEEMKRFGTFEDGIFKRSSAEGRKSQDAYEAVWEYVEGRPMKYPSGAYGTPVLMDPANFSWKDEPDGQRRKTLGTFAPRGLQLSIVSRMDRGEASLSPRSIVFVLIGNGHAAGKSFAKHAVLKTGDTVETVRLEPGCELFEICIPPLALNQAAMA